MRNNGKQLVLGLVGFFQFEVFPGQLFCPFINNQFQLFLL